MEGAAAADADDDDDMTKEEEGGDRNRNGLKTIRDGRTQQMDGEKRGTNMGEAPRREWQTVARRAADRQERGVGK
jgi:hypothetical protein